jgi:hypothetical protein
MGWIGPGEHEGWVVPLFADGAQGAGSSGSKGVLVQGPDGAQEWRPDVAVVGWAAGCECGWRGPTWTRVTPNHANPAGRMLACAGDFYDLAEADEELVTAEWRTHVEPFQTLEAVQDAAGLVARSTRGLDDAVAAARAASASWADIGRAAGMTRQSANERWAVR